MYVLNKIVGLLLSPAVLAALVFVLAVIAAICRRRRFATWLAGGAIVWCWFWASPATYRWLASGLEREFPVVKAEDAPKADAIVVLGGGMGGNTNDYPYGEMWFSADRVWHGARLYRAGKAPRVFVTNEADIRLLTDLGVPREAICDPSEARNTEEEAKAIVRMFECSECSNAEKKPKVLLVTSAWHMRRAKLMFEKYAPGLEVIPAATDYEALVRCGWKTGFSWRDLLPDAEMLSYSSYMIKEIIGYWGYRWVR